ncbi:MAG TPA: hypothetical protein VJB35_01730 [Candidatus Nanoarchaeia archaeon]|nr:hypothetical protein [Candidatus Nanoarchaeia archaeon]
MINSNLLIILTLVLVFIMITILVKIKKRYFKKNVSPTDYIFNRMIIFALIFPHSYFKKETLLKGYLLYLLIFILLIVLMSVLVKLAI